MLQSLFRFSINQMIELRFGGVTRAVLDLYTHGFFSILPSRRWIPTYKGEPA
jgi:hypothetical protein